MKLRPILAVVMATWATGAAAAPAPMWERFPHLVCRPENQIACYKDDCTTKPMEGMWDINFTKGLVTFLGSGSTDTIVGRYQNAAGEGASMDVMLLSSARMLVLINWGTDTGRELEAQVVGVHGPNARTIYLTCAAPK
jgi:hypothetical protein